MDRPAQLKACLQAIADIDYPKSEYEVVVVDDGSSCDINQVILPFKKHYNIECVVQSHGGPAAARNRGAASAAGQIVAFTDDDCLPDIGWLNAVANTMNSNPDVLMGGKTTNYLEGNLYSQASQLIIDYLYEYYAGNNSELRFFCANNMACDLERFKDLGGFSQEFTGAAAEDRDLCHRWTRAGWSLMYSPKAIIFHAHDLTLKRFWRQHFHYGKGAFTFHCRSARTSGGWMKVEPFSFYRRLLTYPCSSGREDQVALAMLMLLSQVANVSGFVFEFLRSRASRNLSHEFSQAVRASGLAEPLSSSIIGDRVNETART
jgi:cellulose synthase/poly-beta-1,6-N-acetylglucosamine synthase-like glycosyltransferase